MENVIIVVVLAVILAFALCSSVKHFKGQGGCCGGGSTVKETKKLTAPKIGEKEILIEGMQCENCKNSVERAVNRIDGAVCRVNLRKKLAKVSYSTEPDDSELKRIIEEKGFTVTSIRKL